jgi:hypothetical protein
MLNRSAYMRRTAAPIFWRSFPRRAAHMSVGLPSCWTAPRPLSTRSIDWLLPPPMPSCASHPELTLSGRPNDGIWLSSRSRVFGTTVYRLDARSSLGAGGMKPQNYSSFRTDRAACLRVLQLRTRWLEVHRRTRCDRPISLGGDTSTGAEHPPAMGGRSLVALDSAFARVSPIWRSSRRTPCNAAHFDATST